MVLAAIDDLFFLVKVKDAAAKAGLGIDFVKSTDNFLEKVRSLHPELIVIDLNAAALSPLALIQALKSNSETNSMQVLAFVSHVQVDLKKQALEAGADRVIARSAFSQNLNAIMAEAASRDN